MRRCGLEQFSGVLINFCLLKFVIQRFHRLLGSTRCVYVTVLGRDGLSKMFPGEK